MSEQGWMRKRKFVRKIENGKWKSYNLSDKFESFSLFGEFLRAHNEI